MTHADALAYIRELQRGAAYTARILRPLKRAFVRIKATIAPEPKRRPLPSWAPFSATLESNRERWARYYRLQL